MKPTICQSCGFSFSEKFSGTNRDRTKSAEYCRDCFEAGEFKDHHLTLHEMERRLLEMAKENRELSLVEAQEILKILPNLKRWRMSQIL